jgi:hypothetical protein
MEQPLAIKEQETLAPSFLASGAIFTGILCPTVYRCPNCRAVYKVILGPGDVFLGEGHRTCSKCHQVFRDRSKEWGMIPPMDRVFFLFPMVVWGWMLVALIVCVLLSWLDWTLGATAVLVPIAIFFAAPLIAWFVFRGYQIVRSVRRFNLGGKTKVA